MGAGNLADLTSPPIQKIATIPLDGMASVKKDNALPVHKCSRFLALDGNAMERDIETGAMTMRPPNLRRWAISCRRNASP